VSHSLKQMSYCIIYSDLPITDWIQAIGIFLGFPAALWGIIKLFKKDKERQIEISSLASLAESQAKMIQMISEQIEIQRKGYLHVIKPFFIRRKNYKHHNGIFTLWITNDGYRALFKGYFTDYNSNVIFNPVKGVDKFIERGEDLTFWGNCRTSDNYTKDAAYCIYLLFEDIEHNQYFQKFIKQSNGHYIFDPVLYTGRIEDAITRSITHEPL